MVKYKRLKLPDCKVEIYRNGTTCVRVTHIPTGIAETVVGENTYLTRSACYKKLDRRLGELNETA